MAAEQPLSPELLTLLSAHLAAFGVQGASGTDFVPVLPTSFDADPEPSDADATGRLRSPSPNKSPVRGATPGSPIPTTPGAAGAGAEAGSEDFRRLHAAVLLGDLDETERLLASGINVNALDQNGRSALQLAAVAGNLGLVECLLSAGASIDAANSNGLTALHFAAYLGHVEVVNCLLAHGADADLPDQEGLTAMDRAAIAHRYVIAALLTQASIRQHVTKLRSVLERAEAYGNEAPPFRSHASAFLKRDLPLRDHVQFIMFKVQDLAAGTKPTPAATSPTKLLSPRQQVRFADGADSPPKAGSPPSAATSPTTSYSSATSGAVGSSSLSSNRSHSSTSGGAGGSAGANVTAQYAHSQLHRAHLQSARSPK